MRLVQEYDVLSMRICVAADDAILQHIFHGSDPRGSGSNLQPILLYENIQWLVPLQTLYPLFMEYWQEFHRGFMRD